MDQQKSSLCISIHNVEFAKDFNYFITVQINADGEKVLNPHHFSKKISLNL